MYRQSAMPGGGTAPISRSRRIPPTLAAAYDSTSTPKMSSLCLMPADAPLNAKTKVPQRSSTSTRVLTVTYWERCIRLRQPCLRGNHQCLHARLQCWMDDRCKAWVVIRRELAHAALRFRLCVQLGIGPAHEPEHGRDMPLGAKRPEVFARRRRAVFLDPIGREKLAEGIRHALGRLRVILNQIIMVERRNLRRLRSP